ncbi:MAG: hypothetical protein Kow0090_01960 [Myxococcota bacterium]
MEKCLIKRVSGALFIIPLVIICCGGEDIVQPPTDDDDSGGTGGDGALGPEEECQIPSHCADKYGVSSDKASFWKCNVLDAENKISRCVCLSNDACPGNQLCHPYTGECYDKPDSCKSDGDCKDTEYCDLEQNICLPQKALCMVCKEDKQCLGDKCGTAYEEKTELKHCSASCGKDSDCDKDGTGRFACVQGFCAPARADCCESDFDCQLGQRCNKEHYVCEAYCDTDEDCPQAQKCCANACVRELYCDSGCGCRTWEDGSQLVCNYVKKECIIPCTGAKPDGEGNCPPGTQVVGGKPVVSNNKCVPPACPMGTNCKPDTGECARGCATNSDCPINQNCIGGVCQSGYCQTKDVCTCGEFCQGGNCIKPSNNYCKTGCTPGLACEGSASNFCLQLGDDITSPTYCGINCATGQYPDDSKCPKGFVCITIVNSLTGDVVGYACYPSSGSCTNGGCL